MYKWKYMLIGYRKRSKCPPSTSMQRWQRELTDLHTFKSIDSLALLFMIFTSFVVLRRLYPDTITPVSRTNCLSDFLEARVNFSITWEAGVFAVNGLPVYSIVPSYSSNLARVRNMISRVGDWDDHSYSLSTWATFSKFQYLFRIYFFSSTLNLQLAMNETKLIMKWNVVRLNWILGTAQVTKINYRSTLVCKLGSAQCAKFSLKYLQIDESMQRMYRLFWNTLYCLLLKPHHFAWIWHKLLT